jgi:phosphatidylglycerol:prolipoprotein diacylglycerol transferase
LNLDAYGIHIGPLYFRYYGFILMFGALLAALVSRRLMSRTDRDPDIVWDALIWALIFGVIGARLYHVFTPSKSLLDAGIDTRYYLTHPLQILMTWQGGLGMPGAIIGGVLGLYIFARRNGISFSYLLDVAAPGVPLAQAVGRWGNFVNQELYGPPTDLPWGILIRPENRLEGYESFERFHPLFLYESLWNLASAGLMIWLFYRYRDRLRSGDFFFIYLILYPVGRFLLEFIRLDFVPLLGINFNQMLMLGVAILSAGALYYRNRMSPRAAG